MNAVKRVIRANLLPYLWLLCIGGVLLAACTPPDEPGLPSPSVPATPAPTETQVALADLTITSIELVTDREIRCPAADQPYQVKLQVENQGTLASGPFVVQLNLDQQLINARLEPGGTIDVLFPYSKPNLHAFVDATALINEWDENNNQVSQNLALPTPRPECFATPTPVVAVQEALATLKGHTAKVWDVSFSPDGKVIASGSVDNTLRLWDVAQERLIRTMQGHPFPILWVKYSPNGATLLTGSTDGALRSWDVVTGQLRKTFEGHNGWITGLAISRDGRWYVSCAEDATVRLWRQPNPVNEEIIDEGMSDVRSVVFTPDSSAIAWGEADGVVRVRTLSGSWLHTLKMGSQPIRSVRISPDGTLLASGADNGLIGIWRLDDGALIQTLRGHPGAVNGLAFSPDGRWLVSASQDGTLRLWKFEGSRFASLTERVFVGHTGGVTSVDFAPNAALIVSGSEDATLRLWALPIQPAPAP